MDSKIKTLLKLEKIPNFRMSEADKQLLEAWKKAQEPVTPKKRTTRKKKTTNEVKESEKETGEMEIVEPLEVIDSIES